MAAKKTSSKKKPQQREDQEPTANRRQPQSLVDFFRQSPLAGIEIDLTREANPPEEDYFSFLSK